jgi:hypothetical protein
MGYAMLRRHWARTSIKPGPILATKAACLSAVTGIIIAGPWHIFQRRAVIRRPEGDGRALRNMKRRDGAAQIARFGSGPGQIYEAAASRALREAR